MSGTAPAPDGAGHNRSVLMLILLNIFCSVAIVTVRACGRARDGALACVPRGCAGPASAAPLAAGERAARARFSRAHSLPAALRGCAAVCSYASSLQVS